jgi:hypothetical protein
MAERETRACSKSGTKAGVVRQKREEREQRQMELPNQRSSKSHGTKPQAGPRRARARMAAAVKAKEEETA